MAFTVQPYCGGPPMPVELAARWNFDPLLIAALAALFVAGRALGGRPVPLAAGVCALALLFVSPLCALTSALFSARTAHHLLLTGLAAPLIVLAMPAGGRHVPAWTIAHAAIFWTWHAPSAYALALASDSAYWLMQASLLVSAVGFWRAVRGASAPTGVAGLLATMMQMGLLGALLTFAAVPLYDWHSGTTRPWGLTEVEDQQLGGLLMWVAGGGLYLAAALRLMSRTLGGPRHAAA